MLTLEEIFPPFGLRITCGDLELRVLRDEDFPELVELVQGGISVAGLPMPFLRAWHEEPFAPGTPDGFPTTSLSWWWTQRATFAPDRWNLALAVRHCGELVGMQDLMAEDFPLTRSVSSGSWLGRAHQSRGLGTLMRQLAVGFAFDELDALACHSEYVVGNHASAAVSRKTGYVANGRARHVQHTHEGPVGMVEQRVVVTPETYIRPEAPGICEGTGALRRFLDVQRR
ncbi:N-acetyltransferase [Kocuria tytonicola]|uniref:N-acetyltransferase n=1 Tax=Kocuria tytonicola TaxID=2055946 RepID=A0A3L9L874_9MICC|nr:GNAT family protein [Kocuria tytonicola]RLY95103.1 N-acetyltransferase [Kocuria tytonicola]